MSYGKHNFKQNHYHLFISLISCMTIFIGGLYVQSKYQPSQQITDYQLNPEVSATEILSTTGDTKAEPSMLKTGGESKPVRQIRPVNPNRETERVPEVKSELGELPIVHKGYPIDDYRQNIVNYAYKLGGRDLVYLMECESGMNPKANGDSGKAFGLCQMNTNYHKLPKEYYNSRQTQVELCSQKMKGGTVFYGPSRKIKGVRCSEYVKDRFLVK